MKDDLPPLEPTGGARSALRAPSLILHPSSFKAPGTLRQRVPGTLPSPFILVIKALLLLALPLGSASAQGFDHEHKAWTELLRKHVVLIDGGKASRVSYAGLQKDRAQLKAYTGALARVDE